MTRLALRTVMLVSHAAVLNLSVSRVNRCNIESLNWKGVGVVWTIMSGNSELGNEPFVIGDIDNKGTSSMRKPEATTSPRVCHTQAM